MNTITPVEGSVAELSPQDNKESALVRLWENVNKNGPVPEHMPHLGQCWIWTGSKLKSGYGQFDQNKDPNKIDQLAHRASWKLNVGPLKKGEQVLHSCDNPSCVRPSHLRPGSQKENMIEMFSKRRCCRKGEGAKHKLTNSAVLDIRKRIELGETMESLASEYRVKKISILRVHTRETWNHI